jgi:hypothetical protein
LTQSDSGRRGGFQFACAEADIAWRFTALNLLLIRQLAFESPWYLERLGNTTSFAGRRWLGLGLRRGRGAHFQHFAVLEAVSSVLL